MAVPGDPRVGLYPLTRGLALVGMAGLVGLSLLTGADVLSRWWFNAPIRGMENVIDVVVPIVIACSLPSGLLHGQDVAIQFLGKWLGRRWDDALELSAMTLTLIFYCVLSWQVLVYANELAAGGRVTEIIRIPMAPWWWATSALLALCAVVQAVVLAARLRHYGRDGFAHLPFETVTTDMVITSSAPGDRR
jgi:TRAP-type C4-dicarboxylate transport system permease small subunit